MRTSRKTAALLAAAAGVFLLAGCTGGAEPEAGGVESQTPQPEADEVTLSDDVAHAPVVDADSCDDGLQYTVTDPTWFIGLTAAEVEEGDRVCVFESEDVADMFLAGEGNDLGEYVTGIYDFDKDASAEGIGLDPIE